MKIRAICLRLLGILNKLLVFGEISLKLAVFRAKMLDFG